MGENLRILPFLFGERELVKITVVRVGVSVSINLGNYTSIKPTVTMEAELEDGDTPERVTAALHKKCKDYLRKAAPSYTGMKTEIESDLDKLLS